MRTDILFRPIQLGALSLLNRIVPCASCAGIADDASVDSADNASLFRHLLDGAMITAGGYTIEMGVETGRADAVTFGCSLATQNFQSGFGRAPPSTRLTDRPPMAAVRTGTRIIRSSNRTLFDVRHLSSPSSQPSERNIPNGGRAALASRN